MNAARNTTFLATLFAAVVAIGASQARADDLTPDNGTVSRKVSIAGLNLASPADQAVLRHRVQVAAHQVCEEVLFGEPTGGPDFLSCYRSARAAGWAQADAKIAAATGKTLIATSTR
jgi:UrcA family protein